MKPAVYLTSSWDDGHPFDLRVAALLAKYRLSGTFYVPMTPDKRGMTASEVRDLARSFEIGAHTIHHTVLVDTTEHHAKQEIAGSKLWVEDTIGYPCRMFCPPAGRFTRRHLDLVGRAGYLGLRTVELGAIDYPVNCAGLMLMPTTVQAHQHAPSVYARNMVKRAAFGNLWQYVVHGRSKKWSSLARRMLIRAIELGGVFHLWGHSWEVQEWDQWKQLEDVLRLMRDLGGEVHSLTNGDVCEQCFAVRERRRNASG